MSISTTRMIRLVFNTELGRAFTISLPNPRANLVKAEAEAAMDTVIEKNTFTTSGGDLIGKRDIRIIDTTTDDLFDPPLS